MESRLFTHKADEVWPVNCTWPLDWFYLVHHSFLNLCSERPIGSILCCLLILSGCACSSETCLSSRGGPAGRCGSATPRSDMVKTCTVSIVDLRSYSVKMSPHFIVFCSCLWKSLY